MQKVVLFLGFTLIWSAHANHLVELLKTVEGNVAPRAFCALDDGRDFSQCLTEVCGPTDRNPNFSDLIRGLAKTPDSETTDFLPFKQRIESFYTKDLSHARQNLLEIKEALAGARVTLDPAHVRLHKFAELTNVIPAVDWNEFIVDGGIYDNRLVYRADPDKLEASLVKTFGASRGHRLKGPLLELLQNQNFQKIIFGQNYGWALSTEQDYPGLSLAEILLAQKNEKDELMVSLKNSNLKAFEFIQSRDVVKTRLIESIQAETNPSEALLNEYFSSMVTLKLVEDYLVRPGPEMSKFNPKSIYDFYPKQEIEARLASRELELGSLTIESAEIQRDVQHCQAIYQKVQSGLPSARERTDFIKTIESYRQGFKAKILRKFSAASAASIAPRIDSVQFDVPASRESVRELMLSSLAEAEEDLDRTMTLKQNAGVSKIDYSLLDIQDLMNSNFEGQVGKLGEICDDYELGSLEDYSLQIGTGKIKVSWLALKVPGMGKGIIAHELGHSLSGIIGQSQVSTHSGRVYLQSRQCLNLGHYSQRDESILITGSQGLQTETHQIDVFVEENWADTVSANFLDKGDQNFACFLVHKNEEGEYDSNIFYPVDEEGTHAPNLYRVLKVRSMMGGALPVSCTDRLSPEELRSLNKWCL